MPDSDDRRPVTNWSQDQVLVLMEQGRDRELLHEWLTSSTSYAVHTATPGDDIRPTYDLCLFDWQALMNCRETLKAHHTDASPVFLPFILIAPESSVEEGIEPWDALDVSTGALLDDVLTMPVSKETFHRRLENLLQTRRTSIRLAERGEQYEELVNLVPETILLLRDDEIIYANSAAAVVFDVSDPSDLLGRLAIDLVDADHQAAFRQLIDAVESGGRHDTFREIQMRTTNDNPIEAEVAGVSVTFEGEPAVQLVVRDVTTQQQRRRQLTLFERAIETASQGITIADARQDDLPLIYTNEAFERITGYRTYEVLGRNCRFLQGADTDESTVAEIRKALETERPVSVEILNYRKDGTPFWNQLEIVPVTNDDGTVTHYLGLQKDVTERKEQSERLTVLDRVLRHNIRNRMNVIRGYAEQLRERGDTENQQPIEHIIDAADELVRISDQVREFQSIISTGDRKFKRQDLTAILNRITTGFRVEYPESHVSLDLPGEAVVRAHPVLPAALEQLFELTVSYRDAAPEFEVSIRNTDGEVLVRLIDRAGTIPRSDLRTIEKTMETPLDHSHGLELWLIRWTVLYSNGSIDIHMEEDPTIELCFTPEPE